MIKGITAYAALKAKATEMLTAMYKERFSDEFYSDLMNLTTPAERAECDIECFIDFLSDFLEDAEEEYDLKELLEYEIRTDDAVKQYQSKKEIEAKYNSKQIEMLRENALAVYCGGSALYDEDEIDEAADA